MSHEQIRRALEDAKRRTGMEVGLPKVTVDASQLQVLLLARDRWQEHAERTKDELAAAHHDLTRVKERYRWISIDEQLPSASDTEYGVVECRDAENNRSVETVYHVRHSQHAPEGSTCGYPITHWRYCDDGPQEEGL